MPDTAFSDEAAEILLDTGAVMINAREPLYLHLRQKRSGLCRRLPPPHIVYQGARPADEHGGGDDPP